MEYVTTVKPPKRKEKIYAKRTNFNIFSANIHIIFFIILRDFYLSARCLFYFFLAFEQTNFFPVAVCLRRTNHNRLCAKIAAKSRFMIHMYSALTQCDGFYQYVEYGERLCNLIIVTNNIQILFHYHFKCKLNWMLVFFVIVHTFNPLGI